MQEKADKNGDVVETVNEEMDPNFPMHEDVNGEYVEVRRDMNGYPVNEIENGLDITVYLNDNITSKPNYALEATIIKPENCNDEEAILKLLDNDFIWLYEVTSHSSLNERLCVNTKNIELVELYWEHKRGVFFGFSKTWYNYYDSFESKRKRFDTVPITFGSFEPSNE